MRNRTAGIPIPRTTESIGTEWQKPYYLGWQKALHTAPQLLVLPVGQILTGRVDLTVKIKEAETKEQRREKMYMNTFV